SGDCLLLVRPESITLGRDDGRSHDNAATNRLRGRLASRAYMGAFLEIRVSTHQQEFLVKRPASQDPAELAVGEDVVMEWEPSAVVALKQA
ncbi:MAG TPA: TOBE domain-containing protein, partial [Casimicrobiaceae bacterium]|nr:TOBE domain-containing protein [Casimicrobiaceae bacterium]